MRSIAFYDFCSDDKDTSGASIPRQNNGELQRLARIEHDFDGTVETDGADRDRGDKARQREDASSRRTKCVLLVESNFADILLVRRALEPLPVNLRVVVNAEEAIAILESLEPDLVLLDLHLPGLDGFHVLRHCQLVTAPVVILTSSQEPEDKSKALSLGASAYIVKPSDADEFFSIIHKIVQECLA